MFTLAIVALLSTGPEYNMQHFNNPQHCVEAGNAIVRTYVAMEPGLPILATCMETDWL